MVVANVELLATWLGQESFATTLARPLAWREAMVAAPQTPGMLFTAEHPPTLTLGRRGTWSDVLWSAEQRAAVGMEVCDAPRGGEVTLHAPGQLVGYPVVAVGREIRQHIGALVEAALVLLEDLGAHGLSREGPHPGVWAGDRKVASVGVHVSRGVAVQGVAINLAVDPSLFSALVPCGRRSTQLANATAFGARACALPEAARRFSMCFAAVTQGTLGTLDGEPT